MIITRVNNKIHINDPYCPHLGANLSDGEVIDGCIKCSFHGLMFDIEDGVRKGHKMSLSKLPFQTLNHQNIYMIGNFPKYIAWHPTTLKGL